MKLALFTRFIVFILVAVLAFGSAVAFAAPVMDIGQGAASNMAMSDGQFQAAQPGCADCSAPGMAKAAMAAYCNAGCFSLVMLPSAILFSERTTMHEWAIAFGTEHSGITVSVDPYPPNCSS